MSTGFFGGRDLKSHFFQAKSATVVGLNQATGTNQINLPAAAQVGDLALFYGIENTSATSSGTQAIAAGPSGWTVLSGAAVAQFVTTPVFATRGVWWKKLTAADIAVANGGSGTGVVSFTVGTLGTFSACGILVFRGGTSFSLISSGGVSGTSVNTSTPAKPAGAKVMIYMLHFRADFNEVITPDVHNWTNLYPGAMFAGAFFFRDPVTWVTAEAGHWSWSTSGQGFQYNLCVL